MASRDFRAMTVDVDSSLGPAPASYTRPEVVVLRFRRHGSHLLFPVVVLVGVAVASGYWLGALPEPWMNLAAAGAAAVGLLIGLVPILVWLAERTTVTSRRAIVRRGFFVRHRSEVSLARVREVRSRRSVAQRMRGSGDIQLLIGNERVVLKDVPGVEGMTDALQELCERNYEHSTQALHRLAGEQPPAGYTAAGLRSAGFGAPEPGVAPQGTTVLGGTVF